MWLEANTTVKFSFKKTNKHKYMERSVPTLSVATILIFTFFFFFFWY